MVGQLTLEYMTRWEMIASPGSIMWAPGFLPGARLTPVFLVAHSESHFGSKIDQKTQPKNQNQVPRAAMSFLARETVGFCLNAHAGPPCACGREGLACTLPAQGRSWCRPATRRFFPADSPNLRHVLLPPPGWFPSTAASWDHRCHSTGSSRDNSQWRCAPRPGLL